MTTHLTEDEAHEIRQALEDRRGRRGYERYRGAFVEDLAKQYGVTQRVIRNVLHRRTFGERAHEEPPAPRVSDRPPAGY